MELGVGPTSPRGMHWRRGGHLHKNPGFSMKGGLHAGWITLPVVFPVPRTMPGI